MAVDITINETIDSVDITVNPNIIEVNVTRTSGGGGGGSQTLAQTLDLGNTTGGENIVINNADSIQLENSSKLSQGIVDAGTGGNKGIALTCAVGFEWKFEAGEAYLTETTSEYIRLKQYARSLPSVNDDISKGFVNGSFWYLDSGIAYICTDSTNGAAVWEIYHNFIPTLQQVVNEGGQLTDLGIAFDSVVNPNLTAGINIDGLAFVDNDGIDEETTVYASNGIQRNLNANGTLLNFETPTNPDNIVLVPNGSGTLAFTSNIPAAGVPYTGATQDVNLGEFGLKAGQLTLDTTPTGTATVATTRWNDSLGSSETTLKGGSVVLKNGVDLVARVVNKVTPNTTLTKAAYQVVKVSGAQGQRLAVDLARANNDLNSADTLGIVTETIATNQEGFIITVGQLEGINTTGSLQSETWADGDVLYLSPTTAGRITNIKPTGATGHIVVLGYVEHAHITQGKIYVKIMNGWELDELHNVFISSVANNQGLVYESATDLWKNKTIIQDSLTDGVTTVAPSQNAVFDALALKQNNLKTFNRTQGVYYFEEFMGNQAGSVSASYGQVITLASGTGAGCLTTGTILNKTNQQGVVRHTTGTLLSGNAGFTLGNTSLFIGQGAISIETYVTIETLSNATERFFTFFGYGVPSNWQNNPNAIFITYDEGGSVNFNAGAASPNFKCYTKLANVTTLTTTSVPVVASQWYKLRIEINNAANSVTFFIDNNLVATHTTNIPATTTAMSIVNLINKTIGTTARTMQTDYFMYEEIFTTAR